jgi:murein DD-endopeptidase MepM/ murein hydrolase activator NlpD
MSAITARDRDRGPDNIRRYRTKCRVRIDSHDRAEPLFISDDVVAIQTGKTIKGAGQANLIVLPTRNYLNLIRPNDYINIYFNIGDGEGWTRTFFGFIDKIEETYVVSNDGKPRTQYTLICTDFYKVLDKTQIYFNPHLAGRSDLSGEVFGTPNIGGLALMTSGVRVHGSSADMVVNLILLMLGFGSQFSLPTSYTARFKDVFRARRAQFVQNRLGEDAKRAIEDAGGFQQLLEQFRQQEFGTARTLANSGSFLTQNLNSLFAERGIASQEDRARITEASTAGDLSKLSSLLADHRIRQEVTLADPGRTTDVDRGAIDILRSSLPDAKDSLLDVVDVFSFVERTAIDGYHAGYSVWQRQGSLISIIRAMSHELMNELIFDLRPTVNSEDTESAGVEYSRVPDEIEGNVDEKEPNGITHVPAMVMREYPFSTIDGIDLRGVNVQVERQTGEIGIVYFGDIFATEPNIPGRHVSVIPNINISDTRLNKGPVLAQKHIDVAVVKDEEVVKTQFGRSDHEHFNLMEFYSDAILGTDQRYYMHDLLPIVTPIHIMRHGLRVRSLTTRFARYDHTVTDRVEPPPDPPEEATAAEEAAEPEELPTVAPGDLGLPALSTENARFRNAGLARWGYRSKPHIGPNGSWVFHQGVDIVANPSVQSTAAAHDIPIHAIADGEIVVSAPEGVFGGYGNVVVIRHDFSGERRYSTYAHLSEILVGPGKRAVSGTRRERRQYAVQGMAGGRTMQPIRVRKGDTIGKMGNTGFTSSEFGRTHLHFEIDKIFPPRNDQITLRHHFEEPPPGFDGSAGSGSQKGVWSDSIISDGESTRPPPPAGYDRSIDPVTFYQENGIDLQASISAGDIVSVDDSDDGVEPDDTDRGPEEDEDRAQPREDVLNNAGITEELDTQNPVAIGAVDTITTRQQLIRWALLQDHWYQHNLEYVSGRVEMRGAPEIRVGYRLDLADRNMSFYVESVNHSWQFPNKMTTSLAVTRGQRNDPFPMYVLPPIDPMNPTETQRRTGTGRLAQYFLIPDPIAVRRALVLRGTNEENVKSSFIDMSLAGGAGTDILNYVDSGQRATSYEETVVLASSVTPDQIFEGDPEANLEQVRISGDLAFELDKLALLDFVDKSLESFDFSDDSLLNPFADPTSETTSGVTGRDLAASFESDIHANDAILSELDIFGD